LAGLEWSLYDSDFGPGGDHTEATPRMFVSTVSDGGAGDGGKGQDRGGNGQEIDPAQRQATALHGLSPVAMVEGGLAAVTGAAVCARTPPAKITMQITTNTASTVAKVRRDMEPLVVFVPEHYGEVAVIIPRGKSCACCERVRHT
jgi:hypothetical protein